MANISIASSDTNNIRNVGNAISLIPQGSVLTLVIPEGQRIFFEQGVPSLFPKNSSGVFAGSGSVALNFQNGVISGKDQASPGFSPVIPSTNQFVAMTVALNRSNELITFSGSSGTETQVKNGVLSGNLSYLGVQPLNTMKLFTVILTSANGTDLSAIRNDLIFSYLNSFSCNPQSTRVVYTGDSLTIREAILFDMFVGASSYQTSRTSVRVGDTIVLERTVGFLVEEYSVTVTGVSNGTNNDTVSFSPPIGVPFILELKPTARVTSPSVYNLNRALFQKNRKLVYDSGWIQVVLGSSSTIPIPVTEPLSYIPMIVWNSTKDSANATIISNSFRSDSSRIGVQLFPEGSGIGTLFYRIGSEGVFYNFETSSLVSGGFIRIFLREV